MIPNQTNNTKRDLWFESQKEAIRALRPDHKVDVTQAVMQQIETMAIPKALPVVGKGRWVIRMAAAACFVGIIVSASLFLRTKTSPVTTSSDLSACLLDIYEFCNDYADPDADDEAAMYDNPVSYFL
ncbi:MAG: hypothetical protein IJP80_07710 [Bacteroidales bacterium]|nr:hypothetical protein [Bacteroidales bacterium]